MNKPALGRLMASSLFFFGEISPNFDLKNMISNYTKGFPRKKWPNLARFQEIK
jgi:hypothetical protein